MALHVAGNPDKPSSLETMIGSSPVMQMWDEES